MSSKIAMKEELKKSSSETKKAQTQQQKKKYKKNAWEQIDIESEKQKDPKYKTEICAAFQENGFCPYGNRCRFAHGKSELFIKDVNHPNYKRKECLSFHMHGFCTYGVRCHFKHSAQFDKIPRSFFQLILMVYAFENLSAEEIQSYFAASEDSQAKAAIQKGYCFDVGFQYLNNNKHNKLEELKENKSLFEALIGIKTTTNQEAFNGGLVAAAAAKAKSNSSSSGGENNFASPLKVKNNSFTSNNNIMNKNKASSLLDCLNGATSAEKISYTYNPKKRSSIFTSASEASSSVKSKSRMLYRKRLSVFQSVSQLDTLRRKLNFNGCYFGGNNYYLSSNATEPKSSQINALDSFYDFNNNQQQQSFASFFDNNNIKDNNNNFNDASSIRFFDKIQKNFQELVISNKNASKVFIPKEYRVNELSFTQANSYFEHQNESSSNYNINNHSTDPTAANILPNYKYQKPLLPSQYIFKRQKQVQYDLSASNDENSSAFNS